MDPCSLTLSVTAIANFIAKQLPDDELAVAGTVFSQLGDTLSTILAQRALCSGMMPAGNTLQSGAGNGCNGGGNNK